MTLAQRAKSAAHRAADTIADRIGLLLHRGARQADAMLPVIAGSM
jgi:hypothetical protein